MQSGIQNSITQKIKTDFRGRVFNTLRRNRIKLLCKFSTSWSRFLLGLKGVSFKGKSTFYGVPYVHRHPMSRIIIGDDCGFRSDMTSNLVGVNRKCIISTSSEGAEISIGDRVGMTGAVIGAKEKITIGNDVLIGANVLITDWDWHPINVKDRHQQGGNSSPVTIENNVWLGLNTVVLKGVTIGKNSIIGANSVVVKSIPSNVVAAGNPCKVIKKIEL